MVAGADQQRVRLRGRQARLEAAVHQQEGTWKANNFPISDLRTEANILAMAKASVASSIAALGVLEYVRKVARERAEKAPCGGRYVVAMRVQGLAEFATHSATGTFVFDGVAEPSGGDPKTATAWTLAKPAPWTNLVFTSRTDCAYVSPVTAGDMRVDITRVGDDRIRVRLIPSGGGSSTASVVCPDAPPIPGQPGPALIGTEPRDFELPLAGGTQPFSGGFKDGGDGWTNTGSITVTRQP